VISARILTGVYEGVNPRTGVTIPEGKKHGRKRLAYTLEEVEKHLEVFSSTGPIVIPTEDGPYTPEIPQGVVRAVVGVAALAGSRVPDIVIQAILRHEGIRTTQRSYIQTVPRVVTAAMKQLEAQIACTAVVQQEPLSDLVN
jgi:hypothetical protein